MTGPVNIGKYFGAAAMLLASVTSLLFAQWPAYPTAGVPKTTDGKPNLTGPAPRSEYFGMRVYPFRIHFLTG